MPDSRNQLISLLEKLDVFSCDDCQQCSAYKYGLNCDDNCFCVRVADYLIVNGVSFLTRARWIKSCNKKTCSSCGYVYYSNNDDFCYCPGCGAQMCDSSQGARSKP